MSGKRSSGRVYVIYPFDLPEDELAARFSISILTKDAGHCRFSRTDAPKPAILEGVVYSGIQPSSDALEALSVPKIYRSLLSISNGLRLLGGDLVFYGLLGGRDRYGSVDGPVPISIEDKFEIFQQSRPGLWERGFRPIGAFASDILEPIIADESSNSYTISKEGEIVRLIPVIELYTRSISKMIEVFSGRLAQDSFSASTFMNNVVD